MSEYTPVNQQIYINNSDGKIFDFNTPSSRLYIGETINSLLRPFGRSCVLSGLSVKQVTYSDDHIIEVLVNPGEVIIDYTYIKFPNDINISIDVSGFDELNGLLVLDLMFNYINITQKNYSKFLLTYVTNSGNVFDNYWYVENENIVLSRIKFDKVNKTARHLVNDVLYKEKMIIENKEYVVYPYDNISKRIIALLATYFNN